MKIKDNIALTLYELKQLYSVNRTVKALNPPMIMYIEPTNHCTLSCVWCPRNIMKTRKKGLMDFEVYKSVIDDLAQFVTLKDHFLLGLIGQGESFIHPRLADMIDYAKSKSLRTMMATNATLLDEKASRRLLETDIDIFELNIHGYDPKTYQSIHRKDRFSLAFKNIIRFLHIYKEVGNYNIELVGRFAVVDRNRHQAPFVHWLFDKLPYHRIYHARASNYRDMFNDIGYEEEVHWQKNDHKHRIGSRCLWSQSLIHWDGNVVACAIDADDDYVVGNIKESPFSKLWNGQKFVKFRQAVLDNDKSFFGGCKFCSDCVPCGTAVDEIVYFYPNIVGNYVKERLKGDRQFQNMNIGNRKTEIDTEWLEFHFPRDEESQWMDSLETLQDNFSENIIK
jgi:radical SAM protein with 4Fe4S-binding SPASM domain